jgi:hypothetical protein
MIIVYVKRQMISGLGLSSTMPAIAPRIVYNQRKFNFGIVSCLRMEVFSQSILGALFVT